MKENVIKNLGEIYFFVLILYFYNFDFYLLFLKCQIYFQVSQFHKITKVLLLNLNFNTNLVQQQYIIIYIEFLF